MFEMTLVDHLRMTFGHIVYRHRAHAQIAYSRSRWNRGLKAVEALLMTGVAVAALGAAFGRGYPYEIGSAVLAILALATLLLHLTFDLDKSTQAHASCATRLWHIREQYRALLSDLSDGAIEIDTVRRRRDELMTELCGVYENAPPADHQAYQTAAQAVLTADERVLTDEEIDRFLPKSLQTAGRAGPA
ncbi:MAG: hypothetical protein DMF94_12815 [Acidobacteria bacterium]|nr:MAG: hypothetical protein DMF94_12815 [Acidobacteriota bacterium]